MNVPNIDLPFQLTESMIKEQCSLSTFLKSENYLSKVYYLKLGDHLYATVQGKSLRPYQVKIHLKNHEWLNSRCTCPSDVLPCKHIIAVLLKFVRKESSHSNLQNLIPQLDADALRSILFKLIDDHPHLIEEVEFAFVSPQFTNSKVHSIHPQLIARKMNQILHQDLNYWNDKGLTAASLQIQELLDQAMLFLEKEDKQATIDILKAVTHALTQDATIFFKYQASGVYEELLEKLQALWIEFFLTFSLSQEESQQWQRSLIEWDAKTPRENFEAALEIANLGWNYSPLQKALNLIHAPQEEVEFQQKIAPIAFRILRRREKLEEALILAKLTSLIKEQAIALIDLMNYRGAQRFIKRYIKNPTTILELSKQMYEQNEPKKALSIATLGTFTRDPWRNQAVLPLLRWARDLSFELRRKKRGIQIGLNLLAVSPSLEDYLALKQGAKRTWKAVRKEALAVVQSPVSYYASKDAIKILLYENDLEAAIQLAEEFSNVPEFLIDKALDKHPQWALQKCYALARRAIEEGSYSYDQAIIWLNKAHLAAKHGNLIDDWQDTVEELLQTHRRKRNLVPRLHQLLFQTRQ